MTDAVDHGASVTPSTKLRAAGVGFSKLRTASGPAIAFGKMAVALMKKDGSGGGIEGVGEGDGAGGSGDGGGGGDGSGDGGGSKASGDGDGDGDPSSNLS